MSQASQQALSATGSLPEKTSRGIVKLVLSGDSLVIRGQPRNGPPPEKSLGLSNIVAPKLGRRGKDGIEVKDTAFAWESREYLRKIVIGKEVQFVVEHAPSGSTRVYGSVWVSVNGGTLNLTDGMISEGLAEVKQTGKQNPEMERLSVLEATAKSSKKGMWNKEANKEAKAVRDIVWTMTNDELRMFVERNHSKQCSAVVEHVRDGSTVRITLLPSFTMLTLAMSGIKCPQFRRDMTSETPEPFAEQAKFFSECRLLQREITVTLEGVSNQIVYGSISHPAGNIAELLLKEGFARCVDWSMAFVSNGKEEKDKLRSAEKYAKKEQLRLWKGYLSVVSEINSKVKNFTGRVVEVGNGDNLVVKTGDKNYQKIFFSSFRAPKQPLKDEDPTPSQAKPRPLYDIPYMFEAREFMRKKLIGKKVNVRVDYVKPAQDNFPEKTCCTVTRDDTNIAEALISKGYGSCLRHRQNDDMRSSSYDDLLAAEARAFKNLKGVHSKKDVPVHRVADISQDSNKARQFLSFLQRAGKTVALVEFVASGSRLRLYLSKDTCLINFILAGVSCPRAPNARDGGAGEPFGLEALHYTKELVMQKEVEVEVEQCDKGGNFIGWLYYEGKNLSTCLVAEGLSKVLPQAERSIHARDLFDAEERARSAHKRVWKDYVEPSVNDEAEDVEAVATPTEPSEDTATTLPERKTNYQKVGVTEVSSCRMFCVQQVDDGPKLEKLMSQMRNDLVVNPPLVGSYKPNKGALCIAKFSDKLWYRCKVEKLDGGDVSVLYIDYGNRGVVAVTDTAKIPAGYSEALPFAKEYTLACCLPPNADFIQDSNYFLIQEILDKVVYVNMEYKLLGQEYATVKDFLEDGVDVGRKMISEGLLRAELKKDRRVAKLVMDYQKAEEDARKNRCGMWCYGDATPDDAREFGYQQK